MTTLSDYNNNPGNLRPPKGLTYEGQIGVDENGFAVFQTKEFGRKALLQDIRAKQKAGLNTPQSFVDKYAPAGQENKEESRDNYKLTLAAGLGLKSTNDPFPEGSEEKIADLITKFEGTTQPPGEPGAEPPAEPFDIPEGGDQAPTFKERLKEQLPGIAGAGVGSAIGTTLATGKKAKQGMDLFADYMRSQIGAKPMQIPDVSAPPGMGLPPAQGPLSNPPAGGRMTQNWIRAQDTTGRYEDVAQKARSMGEAHQMKEAAIAAENKIRQIAPEMAQDPRRAGLFLPTQIGSGPRGAPTVPINTPPSLLDEAIAKLGNIAKGGLRVLSSAPVAGALGGYGTVTSGIEAYEREKAGDRPGAALAGMGTLGALAAVPYPPAQGVGLAASALSPLSLMVLDRMRKIQAEPEPAPATEAEMQEASRPAFRYARP